MEEDAFFFFKACLQRNSPFSVLPLIKGCKCHARYIPVGTYH